MDWRFGKRMNQQVLPVDGLACDDPDEDLWWRPVR
jgi:hypothetical protein